MERRRGGTDSAEHRPNALPRMQEKHDAEGRRNDKPAGSDGVWPQRRGGLDPRRL